MHNQNKKIVAGMMAGFCVLSSQTLVQYGLLVGNGGNSFSLQAFAFDGSSDDENEEKDFSATNPKKPKLDVQPGDVVAQQNSSTTRSCSSTTRRK